jgi:hypothetical protein
MSYERCLQQDMSPGSRGERSVILIEKLLDAQPFIAYNSDTFYTGKYLRGELGILVLSLILSKCGFGVKDPFQGALPIHGAAKSS